MHPNSKKLFEKYARQYFIQDFRVLEIGPDQFPSSYQTLVSISSIQWDTLDLYSHENLTYTAKEDYSYPISSNSYDIVFSDQVLEHVKKIWLWIKELARICKPGGHVITINPVSWPFHEWPVDCWRAYPEGMKALYEEANLEVILSIFESLEYPGFRRYIPGISLDHRRKIYRFLNLWLGRFGWPVERAYDTITIGRKAFPVT